MTIEEFRHQLANFRLEFLNEVIFSYQQQKEKHGELVFER